jgi:hypothetical protein
MKKIHGTKLTNVLPVAAVLVMFAIALPIALASRDSSVTDTDAALSTGELELLPDISREHPGIGGVYVDSYDSDIVYVILQDAGLQETAEQIVRSHLPPAASAYEVHVLYKQYPPNLLARWYRELRDPMAAVAGAWGSGIDSMHNRLEYDVLDEAAIREAEGILEEVGVPRDAVHFEVGEAPQIRTSVATD